MQAQMVLNRMSELIDGSPGTTGTATNNSNNTQTSTPIPAQSEAGEGASTKGEEPTSTEKLDNQRNLAADEENNVSIVRVIRHPIY